MGATGRCPHLGSDQDHDDDDDDHDDAEDDDDDHDHDDDDDDVIDDDLRSLLLPSSHPKVFSSKVFADFNS